MGRERANPKGLICSLTAPVSSQRPERTPVAFPRATQRPLVRQDMALPRWIEPQPSKLAAQAPTGPQWVHEVKFDSYRMAGPESGRKLPLRASKNSGSCAGGYTKAGLGGAVE